MSKIKLYQVAHSRSGDKGNILNLSLIPYNEEDYYWIREEVTEEKVKQHFKDIIKGKVIRYELPSIKALNFVCYKALSGGVTVTLSLDAHGKTLSSIFLDMEIKNLLI